jgi:ribosomal protein S3
MRKLLLDAVRTHAQGHIEKHRANIEVYLAHPVGIGEHSDIIEAIETELEQIAKYEDQIDILDSYFEGY